MDERADLIAEAERLLTKHGIRLSFAWQDGPTDYIETLIARLRRLDGRVN